MELLTHWNTVSEIYYTNPLSVHSHAVYNHLSMGDKTHQCLRLVTVVRVYNNCIHGSCELKVVPKILRVQI